MPLQMAADIVAVDEVDIALDRAFDAAELGLVGDVADRAADRAGAEQGALRAAQRLDAVEVERSMSGVNSDSEITLSSR